MWGVVEGAVASGADPADVYLDILVPAVESVGNGWAAGTIGGGRAPSDDGGAAADRRLGPRFALAGPQRGAVVLGAPPGDLHSLPTAIVGDLLRGAGFEVLDMARTYRRSRSRDRSHSQPVVAVAIAVTTSGPTPLFGRPCAVSVRPVSRRRYSSAARPSPATITPRGSAPTRSGPDGRSAVAAVERAAVRRPRRGKLTWAPRSFSSTTTFRVTQHESHGRGSDGVPRSPTRRSYGSGPSSARSVRSRERMFPASWCARCLRGSAVLSPADPGGPVDHARPCRRTRSERLIVGSFSHSLALRSRIVTRRNPGSARRQGAVLVPGPTSGSSAWPLVPSFAGAWAPGYRFLARDDRPRQRRPVRGPAPGERERRPGRNVQGVARRGQPRDGNGGTDGVRRTHGEAAQIALTAELGDRLDHAA